MEHRLLLEDVEVNGQAAAVHPKYRQINLQTPQSLRRPSMPIRQASGWHLTIYKETPTSCNEHYAVIMKNSRSL